VPDGKLTAFFCGALEVVNSPILRGGEWGWSREMLRLRWRSRRAEKFRRWADIVFDRARGAIGLDAHAIYGNFTGERFGVFEARGPAPGRPMFTESSPGSMRWRILIFRRWADRRRRIFANRPQRFVFKRIGLPAG